MKIHAVVDLPPETFQPYTGTITSILFGERVSSPIEEDYSIFMAVAEYAGHDRRGIPLVSRKPDGTLEYDTEGNPVILDDMPNIVAAYEKFRNNEEFKTKNPSIFKINLSDIQAQSGRRLDAWYYDPTKNDVVKKIWDMDGAMDGGIEVKTISQLIHQPSDVFYPGRHKRNYCKPNDDAVPFLSSSNIIQVRPFDVKWQPKIYKPVKATLVEKGWILVTRSGSTGRVIFVGDDVAGFPIDKCVAVSEHVIRVVVDPDQIDPGYLFSFLSSESIGKVILSKGIYASVVKHITPAHIRALPIPLPSPEIQKQIGDKVREAERQRNKANREILSVQKEIEIAVETKKFEA